MNQIRLFVALVAACILVMPALSMPNKEMGQDVNQMWHGQDGKQMSQFQDNTQKTCDCQKSMIGQDDKQKYTCFGQDGKQKTCDCQKSMMGEDGKKVLEGKDGIENPCGCQKSMMGEDGKKVLQGKDGIENPCGCQKSMMGKDGKTMGHRHIKSMMGDKGRESNGEIKIVIINVSA